MIQDLNHLSTPGRLIVYLLGLTFICSVSVQILITIVSYIITGKLDNSLLHEDQIIGGVQAPFFMYFVLMFSSLATFLLPVIILRSMDTTPFLFESTARSPKLFYIASIAILFSIGPIMQLIGDWNAQLSLPTILQDIEQWMKLKEDEMAVLTERLAMTDQIALLLLNIVVIAVVPALVEEYYFRGALLPTIVRWCKDEHVAVWLIAFIFSAIHLQFFGFFPRLLLGALFGYMFIWTKNIWVPVVAHFMNNATVAVLAYQYTKQGKTYADLQSYANYSIFVYLGSLIITGILVYYFYTITNKNNHGERLD